ncbi:MAG: HepT-like ribonuclease domain-containing protein [Pseudonocardia sp.]
MSRSDEHRIADILDAASKLAVRVDTRYAGWLVDEDRRLVTERLVEIIGEAARAMSPEGRADYPEVDWPGLVGLRNVLVHAYHRIEPSLLWRAATIDIPSIVEQLARAPHHADESPGQPDQTR